jgi:5'-nucleotidase/5'-nucleotidase/UDP-sugar diphosphatase
VDDGFEREQVQPLLERAGPIQARRLGRVASHPDLTTEAVRTGFAAGESALANLITDALVAGCRAAGRPVDLAAIDASTICCGLPAGGELTFGDWFNLMPYADTIRLYRLSGRQLAALLDDNARRTERPGEPHVERGFLQFSRQVRYSVQLGESRDAACAVQVTVDAQSLDQQWDRAFLLACTSFVREAAAPWERYAAHQLGLPILEVLGLPEADTDLLVRDLLIAHLSAHGGATELAGAQRDGRLRIL